MTHHLDVGYEKAVKTFEYMPRRADGSIRAPEYWAYRVRHGRFVTKHGPLKSEDEANEWIEDQQQLDRKSVV
jgi:hypothetical protein